MAEPKSKSVIGRKHSILGKTFRIQRPKVFSPEDITKPVNVRHTAHVGASGHNFGDLSFLEPGGRCSKTNGLECIEDYDSPVLSKVKELEYKKGYKLSHSNSSTNSDSGHGSSTDPDVSDIASEISSRDVKNDLTEDDISDLTSLDQSIKRNHKSCSDISECSKVDYFDFSVDMGPSLLDDVMGTIEKLETRRTTTAKTAKLRGLGIHFPIVLRGVVEILNSGLFFRKF